MAAIGIILLPMAAHADTPPTLMAGGDFGVIARTPAGAVQQATGSFDNGTVKNVTSVTSSVAANTPPETKDAYTLQLNTNEFRTPLCAGKPQCWGWMQFVFANNGSGGELYIKYWLRSLGAPCPAGWQSKPADSCYKKSAGTPTPNMPLVTSSMPRYKLTGSANGPQDAAVFTVDGGVVAVATARELVIGTQWQDVEFNVYGYDDESTAVFNGNAEFNTRTQIEYGGTAKPLCISTGFSKEANNLSFVAPPPLPTGTKPAVVFRQKKLAPGVLGAETPCASAVAIGDTHEVTFAGLAYDFQASGDFVEAQAGSEFEVQTRKVSGAPSWPNTSVNRSVATRMGTTQVALCDGTRLVVDGQPTELASGGSLSLPAGVDIKRAANVYTVRDKAGNSIHVTANTGYTDLAVALGTWPTRVRGLLGNPDDSPTLLEAKDGTRFRTPIAFADLYTFGNSWRVASTASLLRPCAQVAPGNPTAPFFASNLAYSVRVQSETICRQAGVLRPLWLESCTLDVAVLGPRAAAVHADRQQDVIDGNPPRRPPCSPAGC
ncbi:VWD domain-containing protein [Amycolatopsis sp. lyj-108]|uniref:VWD domain-containing protein n=1 Tax=Amycolatopsis sp. lyj-108 TaxID=2789286 RepID=UPI00397E2B39